MYSYSGDLGFASIEHDGDFFYVEISYFDGSTLTDDFTTLADAENWVYSKIHE